MYKVLSPKPSSYSVLCNCFSHSGFLCIYSISKVFDLKCIFSFRHLNKEKTKATSRKRKVTIEEKGAWRLNNLEIEQSVPGSLGVDAGQVMVNCAMPNREVFMMSRAI